ncbi:hypothetical protein [Paenibacillus abyssi]|uniref:Uncharacterized protein n=1 Tax=Paenibacillus abyssi TaxID=1340531 RepID=A0A917FUB2_9BACL|nr:hypothetical protein [Paenibacillus abyssi]GGG03445.1 hypothetical protein GCM10010916_20690 [Paenibacillus abyssi]
METFDLRGLEIHNNRMWRWSAVERALDFMSTNGLNALIFHQNDLIDNLVFPKAYFTQDMMYKRWPIRRSTIVSNQLYIRQVIRKARSMGIGFYLEVKEIWYPEQLLELFPQLRTAEGVICPTNPFWFEFLGTKIRELLEVMPEIAGIIMSPATRESKVSISTNPCQCERCKQTENGQWYEQLLQAMFTPLSEKGKNLVVRDFTYTIGEQSAVVDAAAAVSTDIIVALKNVPHDFWPTFPHNVKIGDTNGLRQWVEFDVWGQYCGFGVFPVSLVEDLQDRIRYCREKGVSGVWFRTDWELMNETSVFNSLNMLNLYGGALLAGNPDIDLDAVYQAWVENGLYTSMYPESTARVPVISEASNAVERWKAFMKASWSVIEKTLYTRGHVFQYSSKISPTLEDFFYVVTSYHSRDQWEPGASERIARTDENIWGIIAEKQAAVEEVSKLRSILEPETLGVPQLFIRELDITLDLYLYYVKNFYFAVSASFWAKKALETGEAADIRLARVAVDELSAFRIELTERMADTYYPFYMYWMLDGELLQSLENDIKKQLDKIRAKLL